MGAGAAAACLFEASSMARAASFSAFDVPESSFLKKDAICFPMGRPSAGGFAFAPLTGAGGTGNEAGAWAAAAARAQLEHASVSYGAASEKHARAISSMQAKLDAAAAELRDMSASLVNSEKRAREQQAAEKERSAAERHQLMTDLAERVRLVGQREAGMNSALAKVMAAEEAMEACITCMACMEVLHEPTTCTPCGHTYCAACLKAQEGGGGDYKLAVCPECDGPAGQFGGFGQLV